MSETTITLPIFPDAGLLTHSSEATYKTCNRKFYLQQRLGLRPAHDSDALRIGSAFHIGLEMLKAGRYLDDAEQAVRNTYLDTQAPPWLEGDDYAVEEETVVAMLRAYRDRYAGEGILTTVAVEQYFKIPIVNPDTGAPTPSFQSAGKIDWICQLPDGRLAIVDHKTTSEGIEPGSDYWTRLRMDHQISRYMLAARKLGYDVLTAVYDVVRKPAIRPKNVAKADRAMATANGRYFDLPLTEMCPERETPKMYGARVYADMLERKEMFFARMEIPRLESDLEEFAFEQWTIQRTIRAADLDARTRGAVAFPRNTAACMNPYRCQFLDICRGVGNSIENEIPAGFKVADRLHPELAISLKEKSHDHDEQHATAAGAAKVA